MSAESKLEPCQKLTISIPLKLLTTIGSEEALLLTVLASRVENQLDNRPFLISATNHAPDLQLQRILHDCIQAPQDLFLKLRDAVISPSERVVAQDDPVDVVGDVGEEVGMFALGQAADNL